MPKGFPSDLAKVSRRKLRALAAATDLEDLRQPPGNRLEALAGDRVGQHSIRVNDQWRLCFIWRDGEIAESERFQIDLPEMSWDLAQRHAVYSTFDYTNA